MNGCGRGFRGSHGMGIGFVGPFLLLFISQKPSHGYELMDELEKFGFKIYIPDQTTVYKVLRSMEEMGLVTSAWDMEGAGPARRVYRVTDKGKEFLDSSVAQIREEEEIYKKFLDTYKKIEKGGER